MTIGNKIVEFRKKMNLTQEKLADELNISRQTISSWESDITSPDLLQAKQLVKIFKISLDELIDNKVDIMCNDNIKDDIFNDLIGKTCYLNIKDDLFDLYLNYETPVKIIDIKDDFIKIEYKKKKENIIKLIDFDLVISIKTIESEDN